ncbi:MAG: hypothetical protein A2X61_14815 [Ignavibacteria bacterium GWB2_35_12]|nr:MAG: hypothetical protein A2X63_06745 [Ignavibacteria bacterium GWA2_35_8]OGU38353.1 MAG: hypothetical protein A2X61_14815 [Ignavibacteria bacterium GWB2_35_12]OGU94199.1 MAG: hypothetical protein A2220_01700 [Ignavibacteria bacterium RIFOXYA2_FULL_35_10]OGV23411.1 MAG: hypothetical protein A2475_06440 [Ignavibacteria bacterium RIFOXYC2_FULL_35_21]
MHATYQINADELNFDFFQSVKDTFKGKEIEISIMDFDETEYLLRSPKNKEILLQRIKDVEEGKNLIEVPIEEFEKVL